MLGIKHEDLTDLSSRLRLVAELQAPTLPATRQPLDDGLPAPEPLLSWDVRDVVRGGGRMYVLGAKGGPTFVSATWLRWRRPRIG